MSTKRELTCMPTSAKFGDLPSRVLRSNARKNNKTSDRKLMPTLFQQEDDAKRAKLSPIGSTTLHDLPIELLEYILIQVVAMEAKDTKLPRCLWKEKETAYHVIRRLRRVCSQWDSILSTKFFQKELYRTLYSTAPETMRLEIMYQSPIKKSIWDVTVLKDEMFMLHYSREQGSIVIVYDRDNITEIKDVISLPGRYEKYITACNVSNCLYVFLRSDFSIIRIMKDEEHQFNISPLINYDRLSHAVISISANGNLLFFTKKKRHAPAALSIYNANGAFQQEILLPQYSGDERIHVKGVTQRSNGNLVLILSERGKCKLVETDTSLNVVCQYQSSLMAFSCVNFADIHGRIMITDVRMAMELLDSEFNLLGFCNPKQEEDKMYSLQSTHYNSARNEIMCIQSDIYDHRILTIFHFAEE